MRPKEALPVRGSVPAPLACFGRAQTVGVDMDLTLLDTRAATAAAIRAVNAQCGESIDVDGFVAQIGPPIRQLMGRWVLNDRLDDAIDVYRRTFVSSGLTLLRPLPGAASLGTEVRRRNGRLVVITSRLTGIARSCLSASGVEADIVVGGVTGLEKGAAMTEHGVEVYIGDHPLDMQGARSVGITAIGVLTGNHGADELWAAGATCVMKDLEEFVTVLNQALQDSADGSLHSEGL